MVSLFDKRIIRTFKILSFIIVVLLSLSFVTKAIFLLFLALGIFVSIISNLLLAYAVYKVVYRKSGRGAMFVDYSKRYLLYILALYFVYKISNLYFPNNIEINFLSTTLGFLSFQIVLYFNKIFLRKYK